jgi:uncharacterized protein (DUF4415 family)
MTKKFSPGRGYTNEDWEAVDSPELSDEDLARARPLKEALPELHASIAETLRKRGPIKTKEAVSIRLDFDVVEKLRASGPGWQSRVNDVLREYVHKTAIR